MNLLALGLGLGWLLGLGTGLWLALLNGFAQGPYSGALILVGVPACFFALAGFFLSALLAAAARLARPGSPPRNLLLWPWFHAAVIAGLFLVWALNGLRYGEPLLSAWGILGLSWVVISPALIAFAAWKGKSAKPHPATLLTWSGLVLPLLFFALLAGDYFWLTHQQARALQAAEMGLAPPFVPVAGPFPAPNGRRVFVLGLDGATWDRIDPLIAQGKLPHFQRLREEGATGRLRTLTPTLSARIWTSLATGKLPEVHGIQDMFVEQAPLLGRGQMTFPKVIRAGHDLLVYLQVIRRAPVTSLDRKVKALWNMASEAGRTVNVVGWWGTWPPEEVKGDLVSDRANYAFWQGYLEKGRLYNLPAGIYTYPVELFSALRPFQRDLGQLPLADLEPLAHLTEADRQRIRTPETLAKNDPLYYLAWSVAANEFYADVSFFLLKTHPADLNLFYFNLLDWAGHFFGAYSVPGQPWSESDPRFRDTIAAAYGWADQLLGRLMDQTDGRTTLVVVSDHGFEIEPDGYDHKLAPDGIIAFYGAQVRRGVTLAPAQVLDVAPTLLALLGLPAGRDMPGQVLEAALAPEALAYPLPRIKSWEQVPRPRPQPVLSGQEELMMKQLKALGYTK